MRELRLVLLGLAAIIALVLGAGFLMRAFKTEPRVPATAQTEPATTTTAATTTATAPLRSALSPAALATARAAVERAIVDVPDYARFFDRLRLVFPGEYDSIMNTLAAASQGRDINVDNVMAEAVAALRHAHGTLAARAPDDALARIFALQLEEMKALAARDAHLCVAFLYGADVPGFLAFAADHRPLVADAATAGLEAMNGGRVNGVERGAPTDADFQTLDHALVDKGLTRPEIDALLDGKTPEPPIADPTMCEAGQTYLMTLAALPAEVRARLYGLAVDLMAKS